MAHLAFDRAQECSTGKGAILPGRLSALINYGVSLFDDVDPTTTNNDNIGAITITDPVDGERS